MSQLSEFITKLQLIIVLCQCFILPFDFTESGFNFQMFNFLLWISSFFFFHFYFLYCMGRKKKLKLVKSLLFIHFQFKI